MKRKRKVKLNRLSLTGLACFFLQEYQHVHLLWFKKRSCTLVWKPNSPLRSVRCTHLCARADAASINQALHLKRSRWKRLSSRDQWNLTPATMCCGSAECAVWSRCFGAAQTMHSLKCDHVKFYLAHSQKNGRNLEPCKNKKITAKTLSTVPVKSHVSVLLKSQITCNRVIPRDEHDSYTKLNKWCVTVSESRKQAHLSYNISPEGRPKYFFHLNLLLTQLLMV